MKRVPPLLYVLPGFYAAAGTAYPVFNFAALVDGFWPGRALAPFQIDFDLLILTLLVNSRSVQPAAAQ